MRHSDLADDMTCLLRDSGTAVHPVKRSTVIVVVIASPEWVHTAVHNRQKYVSYGRQVRVLGTQSAL